MSIYNYKHGSVAIHDQAGTINATLGPGPGNFQISDMEEGAAQSVPVPNRGTLLELAEGDDLGLEGVPFSIEIHHDGVITSGGSSRPVDAILKTGQWSGKTTGDAGGVVWTTKLVVTFTRNAVTVTCTLYNCRCKFSYAEDGTANKITISGLAHGITGSYDPYVWS